MSLCNLALLISIVGLSMSSSINRPQRLLIVHLLPESERNLDNTSDKWKVHPAARAPQVEIRLMKGYISPDEKWALSNEYTYSGKDYNTGAKVIPTSDEKKVMRVENDDMNRREKERENSDDVQDIVMPDRIPQIEFRNIIGAPTYCPKGEKMDSVGRCRKVII